MKTYEEYKEAIIPGCYRHFKGNKYEVQFVARHSETLEPVVVYKALYGDQDGDQAICVRPASMWEESVSYNGEKVKRFTRI